MSESTSTAGGIVTIPFQQIPASWDVPGSKLEILPSYQKVGVLPMPARVLIIGQMTPAGSAAALTVIPNVTTALAGRGYGGSGSIIDGMVTAHLLANQTVPLDIICVADAGGSANAVWTITFGGPSTGNGTPAQEIAGQRVSIGTLNGDSATTSATEFAAAISAIPTLPVTATAAAGVVTVTAKNAGLAANDISFVTNPAPGDALPPGMTIVVAQTVQGATNPDVTAALNLVDTTWYTDIILPWQDATNIAEASAEAERRFNAMVRLDCRVHVPFTGTMSQQLTKASVANARFVYSSPLTQPGSPPWAIAASAGGVCAQQLTNDPSRQLDEIALPGIVGPQSANVPDEDEQQMLLTGGCSVFRVAPDGTVAMKRYVSTYTTNAQGIADPAWFDVMEQAVSSRIRYDWQTYFRLIYPNMKLAPDGGLAAAADSSICTPLRAKGSWTSRMQVYGQKGWVVDTVNQAKASVFEIDPNDPSRLNYQIPYTRIGNLIVDAGQLLFNVGGE